jgi:hypothetical protein
VALLVNNLGGTPAMELYIVAHNATRALREHGLEATRILVRQPAALFFSPFTPRSLFQSSLSYVSLFFPLLLHGFFLKKMCATAAHAVSRSAYFLPAGRQVGPYMTALEMQGVSLSVLPLDRGPRGALLVARLDAPTSATAWRPPATQPPRPPLQPRPTAAQSSEAEAATLAPGSPPPVSCAAVLAACQALAMAEEQLTAWDQVGTALISRTFFLARSLFFLNSFFF